MRLWPWRGATREPAPASGRPLDAAAAEAALAAVEARVERGVPREFAAAVRNVATQIRDLLGRPAARAAGSEDAYVVIRMATDYLPATVDGYLRIPAAAAMRPSGPDGRSPYEIACAQVALLDRKLGDVAAAMAGGDADELAAHGRFLDERFGAGVLSLRRPRRR